MTTDVDSASGPPAPLGHPEGSRRGAFSPAHWWILVIIAGAQLMVVLDTTIMIIALPSAQHSLGFSNTDRQWVVTAYTLGFGGFLLLGGRISDMIGPKRTLMIGVVGFAVASAVGGASQTTAMLIGCAGPAGDVRSTPRPVGAVPAGHYVHRSQGARLGHSASMHRSPSAVLPSDSSWGAC